MNIGAIESTIRIITGIMLLFFSGFLITPATVWLLVIIWAFSIYLLATGVFLSCPVYKLLGINRKKK